MQKFDENRKINLGSWNFKNGGSEMCSPQKFYFLSNSSCPPQVVPLLVNWRKLISWWRVQHQVFNILIRKEHILKYFLPLPYGASVCRISKKSLKIEKSACEDEKFVEGRGVILFIKIEGSSK